MSSVTTGKETETPWPDLSDDLRKLRESVSIKVARNVRQGYEADENVRGMYRTSIRLNVVRNRLLTESYKATEGEPVILRRAKSLAHMVRNLPVYIMPRERIIGHSGETPDDLFYPIEVNWKSPWRAMNADDAREILDDEGRAEMEEIVEYWKGKTLSDLHKQAFEGDLKKYFQFEGTFLWSLWDEGAVPDFEKLFKVGLKGIKQEAEDRLREVIENLFAFDIPCVVISKSIVPPPVMLEIADRRKIPLFSSKLATVDLINKLSFWLETIFAPKVYVHGTMMDVYGVGMLYTGKSGIGKSECALDLVERGHRLVADDVVEIRRHGEKALIASGSNLLGHHMEIRGVGIVDIEKLFGIRSIRMQKRVELEVRLVMWEELEDYERLGIDFQNTTMLGVEIPLVIIPISPGKNLTAISEVISMNYMLRVYGENPAESFVERLNDEMRRKARLQDYLMDDHE